MTTTRITAALAGALLSAGVLAGGLAAGMTTVNTSYMADYGSSITAQDSERQAEAKGVPHMSDHRHSPGYFERMNGVGASR